MTFQPKDALPSLCFTLSLNVTLFIGLVACWWLVGCCWLCWSLWCSSLRCSPSWARQSWVDSSWGLCLPEGCRFFCTDDAAVSRQTGRLLPCCRPDIWTAHPSEGLWGLGQRALQFYLKSGKGRRRKNVTQCPWAKCSSWADSQMSLIGVETSKATLCLCCNTVEMSSFHISEMSSALWNVHRWVLFVKRLDFSLTTLQLFCPNKSKQIKSE